MPFTMKLKYFYQLNTKQLSSITKTQFLHYHILDNKGIQLDYDKI